MLRPVEAPRPPATKVEKSNLPRNLKRLVGRSADVARLIEMLKTDRLVTLTGAGGVGKTSTATEVGAELSSSVSDGVWLVELASLSDRSSVAAAAAQTLAVQE